MTKETFLHDKHVKLGAKMVDFAGWHMPVQYTSIIEEHKTVREKVGLFDVSHMGEVFVKGKEALEFLNSIVPQDISKLNYEKAVYCQLPNKNGGLIDDLIIYKLGILEYLVICNASRIDEDLNWMVMNSKNFDNLPLVNGCKQDFYQYSNITNPMFIIYGEEENYIKNFVYKFIQFANPITNVECCEINGADHNYFGKEEEIGIEIISYLNRNNLHLTTLPLYLKKK